MWYYTPLPVAEFLSDFATTWKTRNILVPSCGDGRFFEALSKAISRNGSKKVNKETVYKVLQIALAVLILGLSSGCHNTLTQEERAGINYVSINPEVSMPRSMYFGTRGGHIYLDLLALDVVSGAMARRLTRGRYIEAMMREHDICPDKMIVNQFREQLEAKQIFPLIVENISIDYFVNERRSFRKPGRCRHWSCADSRIPRCVCAGIASGHANGRW